MNAYEVYKLYKSIRTHFTNKDFDHFAYNGKTRSTVKQFEKRPDKFFFEKIADEYPDDPENLFIANFIYVSPRIFVRNLAMEPECIANYYRRRGRLVGMEYQTQQQIRDTKTSLKKLLAVPKRGYPELFKAYLRNTVDIDTMIVLNKAVDYLPMWVDNIKDSSIWKHKYFLCKKYAQFSTVTVEEARKMVLAAYNVSIKNE